MRDTRHAVRRLVRDWRFTAAAVLILGLGIGANTAIFSLVNATLFRQQTFADPDRLVDIYQNGSNAGGIDGNSYPAYLDMAAYTDVFAGTTAALVPRGVNYLDAAPCGRPSPNTRRRRTCPCWDSGRRSGAGSTRRRTRPAPRWWPSLGHEAWTTEVPRGSVRDRPHHPDRRRAGHDRRGRPAGHRGTINIGIVTDFWLPISSLPALGRAAAHAGAASARRRRSS